MLEENGQRQLPIYLLRQRYVCSFVGNLPAQSTDMTNPCLHMQSVVCAKFCPILFERDDTITPPKPFEFLPYKMVFAIATLDSVVLYDTSSSLPLVAFCQVHFDSITDMSWSSDGSYLAISSRDCFCSIISFDDGELGKKVAKDTLPSHIQTVLASQDGHDNQQETHVITDHTIVSSKSISPMKIEAAEAKQGAQVDKEEEPALSVQSPNSIEKTPTKVCPCIVISQSRLILTNTRKYSWCRDILRRRESLQYQLLHQRLQNHLHLSTPLLLPHNLPRRSTPMKALASG